MKNPFFTFLPLLVLLLIIAGCNPPADPDPEPPQEGALAPQAAQAKPSDQETDFQPMTSDRLLLQQQTWNRIEEKLHRLTPPLVETAGDFGQGDSTQAKVALLGLDGANWKILRSLLDLNLLPNFKHLLSRSSYGELVCEDDSSPVSWTTIATGKNKFKSLGIVGEDSAWALNAEPVQTKRIWDILSKPFGEGFISVSYFFLPSLPDFPKAIIGSEQFGSAQVVLPFPKDTNPVMTQILDRLINSPSDLFVSIIGETDIQQHACFFFFFLKYEKECERLAPLDRTIYDEKMSQAQGLANLYRNVDHVLGLYMESHPHDYLFIVSDHGFNSDPTPRATVQFADPLLEEMGISMENDIDHPRKIRRGAHEIEVYWIFSPWGKKLLVDKMTGENIYYVVELQEIVFRFPDNATPEDLQSAASDIAKSIRKYPDALTRYLTVDQFDKAVVLKSSQEILPSLVPWLAQWDQLQIPCFAKDGDPRIYMCKKFTNDHEKEGIVIASGPGIAKGRLIQGAKNMDITPTLLYLKGRPVGKDMDGKVLTDMIDPERLLRQPIETIPTYDDGRYLKKSKARLRQLSPEEKERLRSLGYFTRQSKVLQPENP